MQTKKKKQPKLLNLIEVLFDFAPINFTEFMIALALAFSVLPVLEIYKFVMRTIDKKKNK